MSQRSLHTFTLAIASITVGILLAALISHLPVALSATLLTSMLTSLLRPDGLQYATMAAAGLFALVEIVVLLPRSAPSIDPTWHMALFPGMPMAVGSFSSAEDA